MSPQAMLNGKSSQVTEQAVEVIHQRIQEGTYAIDSTFTFPLFGCFTML